MQAQALNSPINTFYNKSKIMLKIYLSIMIKVLTEITIELKKRQFIWSTKPKINNETRSSDFKDKGFNVDINKKKASLWCSLIKRLYDDSFHEWKLIPLKLFKKSFGDELKFHSNL